MVFLPAADAHYIYIDYVIDDKREPVWPSGKQRDLGLNPLLFKSCGQWAPSCDCPSQVWNIKMALIAAHLNAEVILVMTV